MGNVNTSYATVADLKPRIAVQTGSSVSDGVLQSYLNAAAEEVDAETRGWRPGFDASGNIYEAFSAVTETRLFDDDLTGVVRVEDLLAVTTFLRGQSTVDTDHWRGWPYNRQPFEAIYFRADLAYQPTMVGGSWYQYPYDHVGVAQVSILGSWGYCTLAHRPWTVKEATLRIAAWAYEQEGVMPKDKMMAMRDPTRPFYWELDRLLGRLKRSEERMAFIG